MFVRKGYSVFMGTIAALIVLSAFGENRPGVTTVVELPFLPLVADRGNIAGAPVNLADNRIVDSAGILHPFFDKLQQLRTEKRSTVSILHIGDSHIQAGYWTGRMRELFQEDFGNAGRGLIVPYKLAGMNEPRDYSIRYSFSYQAVKGTDRGESGLPATVVLKTNTRAAEFRIWSKDPFSAVTVLHGENAPILGVPDSIAAGFSCTGYLPYSTRIDLAGPGDSVTLRGYVPRVDTGSVFYGFSLENGNAGVLYHELGLNGAAFEHYLGQVDIGNDCLQELAPDLIIVSLGTNNCFGSNFSAGSLKAVTDRFFGYLRDSYPDAAILATTPLESGRVRRGRAFAANVNVGRASEMIVRSAMDSGAAYLDMYRGAGGAGSNQEWFGANLFSRDRIHLTQRGYILLADMLYHALAEYFNEYFNGENGTVD